MMFRRFAILLAIACFAVPVLAQSEAEKSKSEAEAAAAAGRKPSGHVSVEVILKNEGVFLGVARKGCLVEKSVRHQYVALPREKESEFGAGIRVWYYDDLLGFLFIPYRQIDEVKVGKELSNDQLERLKAKVEERRLAKEAARQDTGKPKPEAPVAKPGVDAVQSALLNKFPPSEGFSPERFQDLQRSSIKGDVALTAKETEWTKVYPDWLQAYKASLVEPAEVKTEEVAKKEPKPEPSPTPKPEVKTEGTLIGVKAPKAEAKSGGDGAGRGLR